MSRGVTLVPRSLELDEATWTQRHTWITRLLWAHVGVLAAVLAVTDGAGNGLLHGFVELSPIAVFGAAASLPTLSRTVRSALASLGLLASSAVIVHLSGGMTDMHFHFFVVIAVIGLYQHWAPLLTAIAFVAVHHGVTGVIEPRFVFTQETTTTGAIALAALHTVYVLATAVVSLTSWRIVDEANQRSHAAVEASERRFRALVEQANDVVVIMDPQGATQYASPASERLLGVRLADRIGQSALNIVHPDDVGSVALGIAGIADDPGAMVTMEARLRHVDGTYRRVRGTITNMLHEPAVAGFVVNYYDVTERRALEQQLHRVAYRDPVTGLANRAAIVERANRAALAASARPAMICVDLDDFKSVNDGVGQEAGDELLQAVADRLERIAGTNDTVARLGGDDFAVLVDDAGTLDHALALGDRIAAAVMEPFLIGAIPAVMTASVGIAVAEPGEDGACLLRNAHLAMCRAKARGKGHRELYQPSLHAELATRVADTADLHRGILAREFVNHYQPIIDLPSGETVGVEALVRWNHPDRGLLLPADFIPLAEETGHIATLSSQVLTSACADLARWQQALGPHAPAYVSVNLSPAQIHDPGLVRTVAEALAHSGVPVGGVVFEITEGMLLEGTEGVSDTLASLKRVGAGIALDDFGTGYSSLSYLDRFPIDILKIDRAFVSSMHDSGAGEKLVQAILNLGNALGLQVIAEGVETPAQLELLRRHGCDRAQGFLFSEARDAADLRAWLAAWVPDEVHAVVEPLEPT